MCECVACGGLQSQRLRLSARLWARREGKGQRRSCLPRVRAGGVGYEEEERGSASTTRSSAHRSARRSDFSCLAPSSSARRAARSCERSSAISASRACESGGGKRNTVCKFEGDKDVKFRKIPLDNAAFKKRVSGLVGGIALLRAVGFTKDDTHLELTLAARDANRVLLEGTLVKLGAAHTAYCAGTC